MFMWRSWPESWSFTMASIASPGLGPMTEHSTADQKPASGQPGGGSGTPLGRLRETVLEAAAEVAGESGAREAGKRRGGITLERPKQAKFGDYSTNAALLIAPPRDWRQGMPPSGWERRSRNAWEQPWSATRWPGPAS